MPRFGGDSRYHISSKNCATASTARSGLGPRLGMMLERLKDLVCDHSNPSDQTIALAVLREVSARDRDLLIRFYREGDPPEQICSDLILNPAEFKAIKHNAKARFALKRLSLNTAGEDEAR